MQGGSPGAASAGSHHAQGSSRYQSQDADEELGGGEPPPLSVCRSCHPDAAQGEEQGAASRQEVVHLSKERSLPSSLL